MAADALFQPWSFKGLNLKNRIVMAPMTRSFSPGGVVTEDVARYYRRRAAGEVGLIITEGTGVDRAASRKILARFIPRRTACPWRDAQRWHLPRKGYRAGRAPDDGPA